MSGMSGVSGDTEIQRFSGVTGAHNSANPDLVSQSDLVKIDGVTDSENGNGQANETAEFGQIERDSVPRLSDQNKEHPGSSQNKELTGLNVFHDKRDRNNTEI